MRAVRIGRVAILLVAVTGFGGPMAASQVVFQTPEQAGRALIASIESGDQPRFLSIAGPLMGPLLNSGDKERDRFERARLVDAAHRRGIRIASRGADRSELYVGDIPQAFPAPLVKTDLGWRFDEEAGARETTARRIQANEKAVQELCRRFRDAEFAAYAQGPGGRSTYAETVRSGPGKHDGLFWHGANDEDESPIGPLFAAAFMEGGPGEPAVPLFGYYFKILTAQGPDAPGGTADYHVNGELRSGFALIAWPARYGVTGVRSFLINHLGDLYRKDLGVDSADAAGSLSVYNPDSSWSRVGIDDESGEKP